MGAGRGLFSPRSPKETGSREAQFSTSNSETGRRERNTLRLVIPVSSKEGTPLCASFSPFLKRKGHHFAHHSLLIFGRNGTTLRIILSHSWENRHHSAHHSPSILWEKRHHSAQRFLFLGVYPGCDRCCKEVYPGCDRCIYPGGV